VLAVADRTKSTIDADFARVIRWEWAAVFVRLTLALGLILCIGAASACRPDETDGMAKAQPKMGLPPEIREYQPLTVQQGNIDGDNGIYDMELTPDERMLIACDLLGLL
jgi:hypothetical protein